MIRLLILTLAMLVARCAGAATYYVCPDCVAGTPVGCQTPSNGNNGSVCTSPWITLPGTRNTADTGYVSSSWNTAGLPIDGSDANHRIQCGDKILLHPGSVYTSAAGGAWCIANGNSASPFNCAATRFYPDNCGAGNPIEIQVATNAQWGSGCCGGTGSGSFIFDGTGMTPTAARFGKNGGGGRAYDAVVTGNSDGVIFGGNSWTRPLEFRNSGTLADRVAAMGFEGTGDGVGQSLTHILASYLLIHDTLQDGLRLWSMKDSLIYEIAVHNSAWSCVDINGNSGASQMLNVGGIGISVTNCASAFATAPAIIDYGGGGSSGLMWNIDITTGDGYERSIDLSGHPGGCTNTVDWRWRNIRSLNDGLGNSQPAIFGSGTAGNSASMLGSCSQNQPICNTNDFRLGDSDADCTNPNGDCRDVGWPHACCTGYKTGSGAGSCAGMTNPNIGRVDNGFLNHCVNPTTGAIGAVCLTCDVGAFAGQSCGFPGAATQDCGNGARCDCHGATACSGGQYCSCGGFGPCNAALNGCNSKPKTIHKVVEGVLIYKDSIFSLGEYGNGQNEFWHVTDFGTGWNSNGRRNFVFDQNGFKTRVINSTTVKRPVYTGQGAWSRQNSAFTSHRSPLSLNNRYVYRNFNDTFASVSCVGGGDYNDCIGGGVLYNAMASSGFTQPSDQSISFAQANFTNVISNASAHDCDSNPQGPATAKGDYGVCTSGLNSGGSCYTARDCPLTGGGQASCTVNCIFTPAAGSLLIDAGSCYMLAANNSTDISAAGGTVLQVTSSNPTPVGYATGMGTSYNPRLYFVDSSSFWQPGVRAPLAVPDTIAIGSPSNTVAISSTTPMTPSTCGSCDASAAAQDCINGGECYYKSDCWSGQCGGGSGGALGTITLASAMVWTVGACVHTPDHYAGTSPDVGFVESGITVPSTTSTSVTSTTGTSNTTSTSTSSTSITTTSTSTSTTSTTATTLPGNTSSTSTSSTTSTSRTTTTSSSTSTSTSVTTTTFPVNAKKHHGSPKWHGVQSWM